MDNFYIFLKAVIAAFGAAFGFIFGEINGLFYALVVFVVLDYLTGVIAAVIHKKLSSATGFSGILKKIVLFMVVALANIIDTQIIGTGSALRTAVIFLFLSNEGISLLENAASIGVPVPQKLLDVLKQLKIINEKKEKDDE